MVVKGRQSVLSLSTHDMIVFIILKIFRLLTLDPFKTHRLEVVASAIRYDNALVCKQKTTSYQLLMVSAQLADIPLSL